MNKNNKKIIKLNDFDLERIVRKTTNEILSEAKGKRDMFAKTTDSPEFFEDYTYLSPDDCELPYGIYVDSGEAFKHFDHPLCLYVLEDARPGAKVYPVLVKYHPKCVVKTKLDLSPVFYFIRRNLMALYDYAHMTISSPRFYDLIAASKLDSYNVLNELLSNYYPEDTGLPIRIWIDETQAYKRSNHPNSYRLKFQQDPNFHDRNYWMPILIPELELHTQDNLPPCKIPQWKVNKVFDWINLNMDGLMKLKDGLITGNVFKKTYLKKLDGVKVDTEHEDDVPSYAKTGDEQFGYTIVKTDGKKYNFVDSNDILRFPGVWFDEIVHFAKQSDNAVFAYGRIGDSWYRIPIHGDLISLG